MTRARDLAAGTFELATGGVLKLETSDTTVTDGSVLGKIEFKAPDEASGTDANLTAAAIEAVAEGTFAADNNATELVFKTGATAAADVKMTLTSGGNLGIGVTPDAANGSYLQFANGYFAGQYGFGKNSYFDGSNYKAIATGGATLIQGGDNFLFYTAPSVSADANQTFVERMRIDSSGNLLVGVTSLPSASVQGFGVTGQTIVTSATSTSTREHHQFFNGNGQVGSIKTSGSGTSFNTSSDYRLKTDAQPMTGASDRVLALNPVNFEWISDGTRVDGFLAHEAQAVVPESVTGTKDAMMDEEYEVTPAVLDDDGNETTPAVMGTRNVPDYQGIDQSKLVPLLTAALREALTKINTMETRLTALEAV